MTTLGNEPIPGASGSSQEAPVSDQNPSVQASSAETSQSTQDISEAEIRSAVDERSQAYKDLLPKIAPFGIVFQSAMPEGGSPLVVLPEPAGREVSGRYVAVMEAGAKIVDFDGGVDFISPLTESMLDMSKIVYRGGNDSSRIGLVMFANDGSGHELRRDLFMIRDATQEEAMQALQRSITRRGVVNPVSPSTHIGEYETPPYSLKEKILAKAGISSNVLGIRHPEPQPTEASQRDFLQTQRAIDQIVKLRAGYTQDPVPPEPQLTFQEAVKFEEARRSTPNIIAHKQELERITTAKAMSALSDIAHEAPVIPTVSSSPVSAVSK